MKKKSGKFVWIGNINSLFGPQLKFADSIKEFKMTKNDKDDLKKGFSMLLAARKGEVFRILSNGREA